MGLTGTGLLEYQEFGSILLSDVEEFITGQDWRYSLRISAPIPDATEDIEISEETSTRPNPVARMRVRKAHNAARILA